MTRLTLLTSLLLLLLVILKFLISNANYGHNVVHNELNMQQQKVQDISNAIWIIIEKTMVYQERIYVNFYMKTLDTKRLILFGDIMNKLMSLVGDEIGIRIGSQQMLVADERRQNNVLLVDSKESLCFLLENLNQYHLHIKGHNIILLYNFKSHYYDELFDVTTFLSIIGMRNFNVLIYVDQHLQLLFTAFPFTRYQCRSSIPVIVNKFQNSKWQNHRFYVEKFQNFYGCPLVCATWINLPYFDVQLNEKNEIQKLHGIDGRLLNMLKWRLNFTIEFRWLNDKEVTRLHNEEDAILDKLYRTGTDFVLGGLRYKPTYHNDSYTASKPYYFSTLRLILNSRAHPYGPLSKLLFPFLIPTWCCIVFILILCVAFLKSTKQNGTFFIFDLYRLLLGNPLFSLPRPNSVRLFLICWIMASMVLRISYEALLYHFIRTDIHIPPPDTIEDIIKQNYTIRVRDYAYKMLDDVPLIKKHAILSNYSLEDGIKILQRDGTNEAAITFSERYKYYIQKLNISSHQFYLAKEIVFTQKFSMYMRKDLAFTGDFNLNILYFICYGLIKMSETDLSHSHKELPRRMNLTNIYGALLVWFIGISIALCAFICEKLFKYFARKRQMRA